MRKAFRIAMGSGVLVAGLAVAGAPSANAQVRVGGSFRLPHGHVSFSIGDRFPVGGYVPYGYDVYQDARYGYGFPYEEQWIPCEPRGSRWVIVGAPVHYGQRDRYYRDGRYGNDLRYRRDDRRFDRDRRWRRDDRRRDDRWHRGDRRSRDRDGRWRR
jgi:hypothetical protein